MLRLTPVALALGGSHAGPTALWYLSRGTGVVALLLLTAGVVLGVLEWSRWAPRRWPRFAVALLHRDVSLLSLAFIAVHVSTVILDGFAPIAWRDAVIPFVSRYRPVWLGLGALALDLQLAVLGTSLLRRRLRYGAWRVVHWLAYACWPVALIHGLGTGTDTRVGWLLALEGACVASVVGAVWWRLRAARPRWALAGVVGRAGVVVAPLLLAAWVARGPLQPGWARTAGTPASLLAPTVATGGGTGSQGATSSFRAALSGTLRQVGPGPDGLVTVRIDASLGDGATGSLRMTLRGRALEGGGLDVTSSGVTLTGPEGAASYRGRVVAIQGDRFAAVLAAPGRSALDLSVELRATSDRVQGIVVGTPAGTGSAGAGNAGSAAAPGSSE